MTQEKEKIEPSSKIDEIKSIILYNDEVNSIQHVIVALMTHCGHNMTQAEQLATLAHHTGRARVKNGDFVTLLPINEALSDSGLTVEIQ